MKTFNELVVEHLKIEEEKIADHLTPSDVPEWDSMNYLLFISELEKEYGVSFTMDEVLNAQSLGDVKKVLQGKGISI